MKKFMTLNEHTNEWEEECEPLVDAKVHYIDILREFDGANSNYILRVKEKLWRDLTDVLICYERCGGLTQLSNIQFSIKTTCRQVDPRSIRIITTVITWDGGSAKIDCVPGEQPQIITEQFWHSTGGRVAPDWAADYLASDPPDPRTPAGCEVPDWVQDLATRANEGD